MSTMRITSTDRNNIHIRYKSNVCWRSLRTFVPLVAISSVWGTGIFGVRPTIARADDAVIGSRQPESLSSALPLALAMDATEKASKGDYSGASNLVVRALKATPADANLHVLAGTILLRTGDSYHARLAFQNAQICDPGNGQGLYGFALTQLAAGNRSGALQSLSRAENVGGDRSHIELARNYIALLSGARIAVSEAGFPPAFAASQQALTGMNGFQIRDLKQAQTGLLQAQLLAPGDPFVQPDGILMTFDSSRPLAGGAPALPKEMVTTGLAAPLPAQRGLSGTVQITPENTVSNVISNVAYVTYEIDGKPQGILNIAPYTFTLDTRSLTNGWHNLLITTFDRNAVELGKVTRRIRTFNNAPSGATASANSVGVQEVERLQGRVWSLLTLMPDRYAAAYALGQIAQTTGKQADARNWYARACAYRPDSVEARRAWQSCGGASVGAQAMWGGLPDEKVVAFTFDDGPKPGLTEPLLELLTSLRVPATFFVIGRHVTEYPDLTRQIVAAGMEIANHSYTHRNLTRISPDEVAREVIQTQVAVESVTGKAPRYLRPPGGNWNGSVANIVRQWGLTPCMWTVDVDGSEVIGAQQVADAVLSQVRPGSVVLMHNGKLSTLQALPTIIKELRARGYTFATVDALAKRLEASKEAAKRAATIYAKTRRSE